MGSTLFLYENAFKGGSSLNGILMLYCEVVSWKLYESNCRIFDNDYDTLFNGEEDSIKIIFNEEFFQTWINGVRDRTSL